MIMNHITTNNKNYCDNSSNPTADIVTTLRGFRQRENQYYNRPSMFQFLQQQKQPQQEQEYTADTTELYWESRRRQMIAWQFSLAKACDFHTDTIEVAMSVVDRFVAVQQQLLHQATRYQLACMASFYLAVKVHQSQCLTPEQIQTLSAGRFQASDIEAMEREILQTIQWRVNPPTIAASCESLVQLIPSTMLPPSVRREQVLEVAVALIPLALPEDTLATESVLELSLACVANALRCVLPKSVNHKQDDHNSIQFLYHHLETEVDLYRTDRLQFQLRSLVIKSLALGMVLHPVLAEHETLLSDEDDDDDDDDAMVADDEDEDKDQPCRDCHDEPCQTSPRSVGVLSRYISILLG